MKVKLTAILIAFVLGGCAHAGAIQKSPCACDFHSITKQSFV